MLASVCGSLNDESFFATWLSLRRRAVRGSSFSPIESLACLVAKKNFYCPWTERVELRAGRMGAILPELPNCHWAFLAVEFLLAENMFSVIVILPANRLSLPMKFESFRLSTAWLGVWECRAAGLFEPDLSFAFDSFILSVSCSIGINFSGLICTEPFFSIDFRKL